MATTTLRPKRRALALLAVLLAAGCSHTVPGHARPASSAAPPARSTSAEPPARSTAASTTAAPTGSDSASPADPPRPFPAVTDVQRAQLEAILTEQRIESDVTRELAGVPNTVFVTNAVRQFRNALYADDGALRRLPVPAGLQPLINAVLVDDISYLTGLDRLVGLSDPAAIRAGLLAIGPAGSPPTPIDQAPSVRALRAAAGLPAEPDLLTARPTGTPVYADDFSVPGSFALHPGVVESGGSLTVTTTGGAVAAPAHRHAYDGRYTTVQAVFSSATDAAYGLTCPHLDGQSEVLATVRPNGAVSLVSQPAGGGPGSLPLFAAARPDAVETGRNTVRLDCVQYAPGYAVVRLFLNGTLLAGLGAPGNLPVTMAAAGSAEPAVGVIAGSGPAVVSVDDFAVASLPVPAAAPVPIPPA